MTGELVELPLPPSLNRYEYKSNINYNINQNSQCMEIRTLLFQFFYLFFNQLFNIPKIMSCKFINISQQKLQVNLVLFLRTITPKVHYQKVGCQCTQLPFHFVLSVSLIYFRYSDYRSMPAINIFLLFYFFLFVSLLQILFERV